MLDASRWTFGCGRPRMEEESGCGDLDALTGELAPFEFVAEEEEG